MQSEGDLPDDMVEMLVRVLLNLVMEDNTVSRPVTPSCNHSGLCLAPKVFTADTFCSPYPQDVATGALQLLFRNFSQREEMTTTFKQVQLLVSETDVSIYRHTRKDLDRLRMIVEKSELWVDRIDDVSGGSLSLVAKQNFAEILRCVSVL